MAVMKRWYRSRRNQFILITITIICILYYISLNDSLQREPDLDITRSSARYNVSSKASTPVMVNATKVKLDINSRTSVIEFIETRLQEALKEDKGTGCEIPQLDPFAQEVMKFDKALPKVTCRGQDWVRCYHSECRVVDQILATTKNIVCSYQDIIYVTDRKYHLGPATEVQGNKPYILEKSDHVKIKCTGTGNENILPSRWLGFSLGFRKSVERKPAPPSREDTLNVLIFGFDSTSKNGFIRKMPKTYDYLKNYIQDTVILDGYNIVGDGTPAALFPILTGKTELELPDVRIATKNNETLDSMPFIFYKLKDDGYRTAYFEDMPTIGTFQYRFKGFSRQPADHYLRAFYLEQGLRSGEWGKSDSKYCVGDTPRYQLMMNITDQFLRLDGKKFVFTFVADICHDDANLISTADDGMLGFLQNLVRKGTLEDTLLIVMGDHGPRYAQVRDTLQGKLEERLPLMCVRLPEKLKRMRPKAQANLEKNINALTTPHDIHATILDVLDWTQHSNPHKVAGADLPRAMSLLEVVPRNRSCSEAGIEAHWCACVAWKNTSQYDTMYLKTAVAFIDYINSLTEAVRELCVPRTLKEIKWVMSQQPNRRMLSFVNAKDADGFIGNFGPELKVATENYQLKVVVGPGHGIYEASMTYVRTEDKFLIDTRDISRTNAYGEEPSCISTYHPHLNMYCYCKDFKQ